VSKLRQHLQRAARAFADELFEAIQAEFRGAPRQPPPDTPRSHPQRPAPALKPKRRRPGSSSTDLERVLVYVTEHPGTAPKSIIEATGIHRPSVFAALRDACTMGALVKHGEWRHVTYAPAGHARAVAAPPVAPRRKYQRTAVHAADICEEVVAWVAAHPGCVWSEIAPAFRGAEGSLRAALGLARANRRVRMEGTRRTARYYATDLPG
jgi:hypothetical protein